MIVVIILLLHKWARYERNNPNRITLLDQYIHDIVHLRLVGW